MQDHIFMESLLEEPVLGALGMSPLPVAQPRHQPVAPLDPGQFTAAVMAAARQRTGATGAGRAIQPLPSPSSDDGSAGEVIMIMQPHGTGAAAELGALPFVPPFTLTTGQQQDLGAAAAQQQFMQMAETTQQQAYTALVAGPLAAASAQGAAHMAVVAGPGGSYTFGPAPSVTAALQPAQPYSVAGRGRSRGRGGRGRGRGWSAAPRWPLPPQGLEAAVDDAWAALPAAASTPGSVEVPVLNMPLGASGWQPLSPLAAPSWLPAQFDAASPCSDARQRPLPLPPPPATHGMLGVSGSGSSFKMTAKLLPVEREPLRIPGYRTAALAATAHDHARLWLALRTAPGGGHPAAPLPELAAVVTALPPSELNFPASKYLADAAVLPKLADCGRQQLEAHLHPHALALWDAATGGACSQGEDGAVVDQLRIDNRTGFHGVSRVTGSMRLSAAINVNGCRLHLGTFDTEAEAAVVRDVGVLWKQAHGMLGDKPLNLPELSLDKDECLLRLLLRAPDANALRQLMDAWVADNLADVVSCLPDPEAQPGGQRAALERMADVLGQTGAAARLFAASGAGTSPPPSPLVAGAAPACSPMLQPPLHQQQQQPQQQEEGEAAATDVQPTAQAAAAAASNSSAGSASEKEQEHPTEVIQRRSSRRQQAKAEAGDAACRAGAGVEEAEEEAEQQCAAEPAGPEEVEDPTAAAQEAEPEAAPPAAAAAGGRAAARRRPPPPPVATPSTCVWQDPDHERLEKTVTAAEAASKAFTFPPSVWDFLTGSTHGDLIVRHLSSGSEWTVRVSAGGTIELPDVFDKLSLRGGSRLLLRSSPPKLPAGQDAEATPLGLAGHGRSPLLGGRTRGVRSRSQAQLCSGQESGELPVVDLQLLAPAAPAGLSSLPQQQLVAAASRPSTEGHAPPAAKGRTRSRPAEPKQCSHCGAQQPGPAPSYAWRRHPSTKQRLCFCCYKHADKHGGKLPLLESEEPRAEKEPEQQQQQQPDPVPAEETGKPHQQQPQAEEQPLPQPRAEEEQPPLGSHHRRKQRRHRLRQPAAASPRSLAETGQQQQQEQQQQPVEELAAGDAKHQQQAEQEERPPSGRLVRKQQQRLPASGFVAAAAEAALAETAVVEAEPAAEARAETETGAADASAEPKRCGHCGTDCPGPTPTYPWRKNVTGNGQRLCKDCWQFQRSNRGFLPDLPHPAAAQQQPEAAAEGVEQEEQAVATTAVNDMPAAAAAKAGRRRPRVKSAAGDATAADGAAPPGKRQRRQAEELERPHDAAMTEGGAVQPTAGSGRQGASGRKPQQQRQPHKQQQAPKQQQQQRPQMPQQRQQQQRDQEEQEEEEEQLPQQSGRRCLECSGTRCGRQWHRHPSTGQQWVCNPCFTSLRAEILKQQRQQLAQQSEQKEEGEVEQEEEEAGSGGEEEAKEERCSHCGVDHTTGNRWQRHPTTGQRLCHACRQYMRDDGQLPSATTLQKRRAREQRQGGKSGINGEREGQAADEGQATDEGQAADEQCTHCGGGRTLGGNWRMHPTTRQRLCGACGVWCSRHGGQLPPPDVLQQRREKPPREQSPTLQQVAGSPAVQATAKAGKRQGGQGRQEEDGAPQPAAKKRRKQQRKQPEVAPAPADALTTLAVAAAGEVEAAEAAASAAANAQPSPGAGDAPGTDAKRGRGGGLCLWVNEDRTAADVEVNAGSLKAQSLRLQAKMAYKLVGLRSGSSLRLRVAGSSGPDLQAELSRGAISATELFTRLGVKAGDHLLLARLPADAGELPLLAATKLAPGKEATEVLVELLAVAGTAGELGPDTAEQPEVAAAPEGSALSEQQQQQQVEPAQQQLQQQQQQGAQAAPAPDVAMPEPLPEQQPSQQQQEQQQQQQRRQQEELEEHEGAASMAGSAGGAGELLPAAMANNVAARMWRAAGDPPEQSSAPLVAGAPQGAPGAPPVAAPAALVHAAMPPPPPRFAAPAATAPLLGAIPGMQPLLPWQRQATPALLAVAPPAAMGGTGGTPPAADDHSDLLAELDELTDVEEAAAVGFTEQLLAEFIHYFFKQGTHDKRALAKILRGALDKQRYSKIVGHMQRYAQLEYGAPPAPGP